MSPNAETGPWLARVNLLMQQAPGSVPSTIRIKAGGLFYLDGTEGFDFAMALNLGHIVAHEPDGPQPTLLQQPKSPPRRRRRAK